MDPNLFIALINPAISLIFAAAFFMLWGYQRRRYIAVIGAGLVILTFGLLLQYFLVFGFLASKFLSNLCFLAGGVGLMLGTLARYGRPPSLTAILLLTGSGLAAYSWFLFIEPSLSWRIYTINFAMGGISLLLAMEVRAVVARRLVDNLLMVVLALWGVMLFVRPILIMWIDGPYVTYENFEQSLYRITFILSATLFLLLYGLIMITAIALDVMNELKQESQTDPLSGLLNRRGFEEGARDALKLAQWKGMPCALVVCDLDHFKSVNDTYGHACGDNVIVTFSECLRTTLGDSHLIGRVGGEEFAILVPGANVGTARLFAEGVRAAFGALQVPDLPDYVRCSASFGVAEINTGESIASLFDRADHALYEAKNSGRDCVRVSTMPRLTSSEQRAGASVSDVAAGI